ncbi:MAG: class I SAM-dependent methyltransferase [Chloroflexota bacterium]|nr:class I SAM-dependent methyltransferase [Chloroflexota bacterium]
MKQKTQSRLQTTLWEIYDRPQPPVPWRDGDNLPWDDPDFSERMLREHLDQSHGAASRRSREILQQSDWLWDHLNLRPGARLLDITCGPGLYATEFASRGVQVTGIDFSPASIRHARKLAEKQGVEDRCSFIRADVRGALPEQAGQGYDAAIFIYGQLSVFRREEVASLLEMACSSLRAGGRLAVELLDYDRIDKKDSNFWFTDDTGLWSESAFFCLGERHWDPEQRASIDRFHIIDLATGNLQVVAVSENGYETQEMLGQLNDAGFSQAWAIPAWRGIELYDGEEWMVYLAER